MDGAKTIIEAIHRAGHTAMGQSIEGVAMEESLMGSSQGIERRQMPQSRLRGGRCCSMYRVFAESVDDNEGTDAG